MISRRATWSFRWYLQQYLLAISAGGPSHCRGHGLLSHDLQVGGGTDAFLFSFLCSSTRKHAVSRGRIMVDGANKMITRKWLLLCCKKMIKRAMLA